MDTSLICKPNTYVRAAAYVAVSTSQSPFLPCRLASAQCSTEVAVKAGALTCAIVEADAEALAEANSAQEVISIDLDTPAHFCCPVLWKACSSVLHDVHLELIARMVPT